MTKVRYAANRGTDPSVLVDFKINTTEGTPRHRQVRHFLRELIRELGIAVGERLPSERFLANRLGVSQMTVNRAMTELAREGILIRERGRGTFLASLTPIEPLKGRRTWGVVLPYSTEATHDYYVGPILRGVQRVFRKWHDSLLLEEDPQADYRRLANESSLDGLLVIAPGTHRKEELLACHRAGLRLVVVGSSWEDASLPCVDSDNINAARQAVAYLASLGHQRIMALVVNLNSPNSRDRLIGFRNGIQECGLPLTDDSILDVSSPLGPWSQEAIRRFEEVMRKPDRPTALFGGGYLTAIRSLEQMRRLGLNVPADVSLVAFDDPMSGALHDPPLTTIRQPLESMGERAAHRISSAKSVVPGTELLSTTLIIRQSCRAWREDEAQGLQTSMSDTALSRCAEA